MKFNVYLKQAGNGLVNVGLTTADNTEDRYGNKEKLLSELSSVKDYTFGSKSEMEEFESKVHQYFSKYSIEGSKEIFKGVPVDVVKFYMDRETSKTFFSSVGFNPIVKFLDKEFNIACAAHAVDQETQKVNSIDKSLLEYIPKTQTRGDGDAFNEDHCKKLVNNMTRNGWKPGSLVFMVTNEEGEQMNIGGIHRSTAVMEVDSIKSVPTFLSKLKISKRDVEDLGRYVNRHQDLQLKLSDKAKKENLWKNFSDNLGTNKSYEKYEEVLKEFLGNLEELSEQFDLTPGAISGFLKQRYTTKVDKVKNVQDNYVPKTKRELTKGVRDLEKEYDVVFSYSFRKGSLNHQTTLWRLALAAESGKSVALLLKFPTKGDLDYYNQDFSGSAESKFAEKLGVKFIKLRDKKEKTNE